MKLNEIYEWKTKGLFSVSAEDAAHELARIAERHGGILTPHAVVDESRPKDAPLHSVFEWNDDVAAEKYREEQARWLIRNIVIKYPDRDEEEKTIRAYVHVVDKEQSVYVETKKAMEVDYLRKQVIEQARRDMEAFIRRYEAYEEFAGLIAAIKDYLKQMRHE